MTDHRSETPRNPGRRATDRAHAVAHAEALAANKRLRKVAWGALVCWAVIATVACVALVVSLSQAKTATDRANTGVSRANIALAQSSAALNSLEIEAKADCYRVNVLRYDHNVAAVKAFQSDTEVAGFLRAAIREATKLKSSFGHLADSFGDVAKVQNIQPQIDCPMAISHPAIYNAPPTLQIYKLTPAQIKKEIGKPPVPPAGIPSAAG